MSTRARLRKTGKTTGPEENCAKKLSRAGSGRLAGPIAAEGPWHPTAPCAARDVDLDMFDVTSVHLMETVGP